MFRFAELAAGPPRAEGRYEVRPEGHRPKGEQPGEVSKERGTVVPLLWSLGEGVQGEGYSPPLGHGREQSERDLMAH